MPVTSNVELGEDVVTHHPDLVNFYGCSIGNETRIGTSEIAQDQSIMLPLYQQIMEEDQSYVIKVLWEAC
jgi:dTDP-4-amino-4,6-dideoxygalactose transaminase